MRYWKFVDSVQSCSNDAHVPAKATEITREEFDAYLSALPSTPPAPTRDTLKELEDNIIELRARVETLETTIATRK